MTGEQRHGRNSGGGVRNPARGNRYTSDSEFINIELSEKQTSEYRLWRDDLETVIVLWTELVEGGYRVNTKYDDYSSACAAFIIPDEQSDNSGFILTGRGGNAYRAVSEAIFKHYEVLHGDWNSHSKASPLERDADF